MNIKYNCENYPILHQDWQERIQKLLFWEYVEEAVQLSHAQRIPISTYQLIIEDLKELEREERFELCMLYRDMLKQFEKQLLDIG